MNEFVVMPYLAEELTDRSTTIPKTTTRKGAQRLSVVRDATMFAVRDVTVDGSRQNDVNSAGSIVGVPAGVNDSSI